MRERFAYDIDRAFAAQIEPCEVCGSSFRFELEALAIAGDDDFMSCAVAVSWKYRLNVDATLRYFDALAGFRPRQ